MNKQSRLSQKWKEILQKSKGFTLTELLVATMIMVLATGALTSAMILAIRHFYESTQRSEAQFLCATLAEFVEDELSFAVVNGTAEDASWSRGTHNMGSDISFYVRKDEDGSYEKVGTGTLGTYGKLAVTGDNYTPNYFMLASDGAYEVEKNKGYDLEAAMSLKWEDANHWFVVQIKVIDRKDHSKELAKTGFTVKPAMGTS